MLIWDLIKARGVAWTRATRERQLFWVCVQVQARLMARHPGYRTTQVHHIPPAVVEEVKGILDDLLSREDARGGTGAGTMQAPQPDPRL
jgi:hypothetical protein